MKNVDYVYILLLTIIAALLLMLVMKPGPQPVKPRVYSEVVCENYATADGGVALTMGGLKPKSRGYLKAKAKLEDEMTKKLKDGWVVLPQNLLNGVVTCFAR